MKKVTLFLAGMLLVGAAFAGDGKGKSGCCSGKKDCHKEEKAKADKGTAAPAQKKATKA